MTAKRARTPKKAEPKQVTEEILPDWTDEDLNNRYEDFLIRMKSKYESYGNSLPVIVHQPPGLLDREKLLSVFCSSQTHGKTSSINVVHTIWHDDHIIVSRQLLGKTEIFQLIKLWEAWNEFYGVIGLNPRRELLHSWWVTGQDPSGHFNYNK